MFFSKTLFFCEVAVAVAVVVCSGPVRLTPEKYENGVFTLKMHKMFSVHTTPVIVENAKITGNFGFAFEGNLGREIT